MKSRENRLLSDKMVDLLGCVGLLLCVLSFVVFFVSCFFCPARWAIRCVFFSPLGGVVGFFLFWVMCDCAHIRSDDKRSKYYRGKGRKYWPQACDDSTDSSSPSSS